MSVWPYSTRRWQRLRQLKLRACPLCTACLAQNRIEQATVVDHVVAITAGGDPFPALDKLASLCTSCHSQKTRNVEQLGRKIPVKITIGSDGYPIDPEQ